MPEGQRTLLGFDYGKKRIGIAIGQEVTGTVNPLTTLIAKNNNLNLLEIRPSIDSFTLILSPSVRARNCSSDSARSSQLRECEVIVKRASLLYPYIPICL